jgi:hypothetical protein
MLNTMETFPEYDTASLSGMSRRTGSYLYDSYNLKYRHVQTVQALEVVEQIAMSDERNIVQNV